MIKLILCILLGAVNANAGKVVMEGIDTTNSTIFVDTTNTRVGISTNSPSYRLDVYGDIRATGTIYGAFSPNATVPPAYIDLSTVTTALAGKLTAPATFYVVKTSDYLVAPASFTYLSNASAFLVAPASFTYQAPGLTVLKAGDTMTGSLVGTNAYMSANVTADTMTVTGPSFSVGGSTLVVDNGRVAVGTDTFNSAFSILNNSVDAFHMYVSLNSAGGPTMRFRKARGTDFGTIVNVEDTLGSMVFQGYDGAAWRNSAVINGTVDGTPGSADMPGRLMFSTTPDGSATQAERMRITSAGRVGINTTTPGSTLHVNGDATISGAVTMASSATVTGAARFNGINIQGANYPGNGAGLELNYDTGVNYITGYNRTGGAYLPIVLSALDLSLYTANTPRLTVTNAGHVNIVNGLTASSGTFTGAIKSGTELLVNSAESSSVGGSVYRLNIQGNSVAPSGIGTESILNMYRPVQGGVSYPNAATFAIGRHKVSDTNPNTRLDLIIKDTANGNNFAESANDTTAMTWLDTGNVGIGTTAPGAKLDIKDGSVYLTDSDVAHGITAAFPTDVFGAMVIQDASAGGLSITGLNDGDVDRPIGLYGYFGSDNPTDTYAAIHLQGGKKNGTGLQVLGDAEIVMRIRNYTAELLTIKGNGAVTLSGSGRPTTGGALCLNASGVMSKCTSAVDASGNCTCP